MEFVNNTNIGAINQGTPARRTPISNDITQFLQSNTPGSSNSPTPNMNNTGVGGGAKEKKNAKVKRSEVDDDIEMLEEDSDADDIAIVSDAVETPSTDQQPTSSGENEQQEIIDITADNDVDDIVPISPPASGDSTVNRQKMTSIKQTIVDDDIEIIEEDDPNQQLATSPLPYITAETPSELQRSSSIMSETNDHSRIVLSSVNETHGDEALNNVSNDVAGDPSLNTAADEDPSPALNKTHPLQNKRTPAPNTPFVQKRKIHPGEYEYGRTFTNKPNGRLIVFEENDRQHCREYTCSSKNSWYCRFCYTITKQKYYACLNADKTLDVPIHHFCKPITYEESKRDQEKIKEKCLCEENRLKQNARASSVFGDSLGDNYWEPSSSVATSSRTINGPVNSYGNDNIEDDLSETIERLKRERTSRDSQQHNLSSSSSTNLCEVFAADWKYGYDKCGKYSKRIIVFESNDRNYAREYGNSKGCKRCHGCFRTGQKTRTLKWQDESRLFVPTNHVCKPRLYSEIEREQREFAEKSPGRSTENNGRGGKRSRIYGGESLREESETPLNHAPQEDANADNGWNEFVEPSTPPSNVDSVNPQPVASPLQSPSPPLSVENFPESNDFYSFRFYHPSGAFLDECCEKLELDYQIQAYQFWANISLTHIRQDSIPRLTHTTVNHEMSGFSSISLLFTGSEGHAGKIKNGLNKYFLQNSITIGGIVGQNLSQTFNPKVVETLSSDDLTDIHFVTLAHLLECRIALFKNGAWKRFGRWTDSDSGEYVPVILLESKIGKYFPIFSF